MNKLWETLVRWRTWLLNSVAALMIVLPDLLNAPEVIAVIPVQYQKYVFVAALLINVWMRPRPAATKDDAEVKVRETIKAAKGPATVTIETEGVTKAVIHG